MEPTRIICKATHRAADIDGTVVSYGRMTPDMVRFNPFWWQHEQDPLAAAVAWVRSAHVAYRDARMAAEAEICAE